MAHDKANTNPCELVFDHHLGGDGCEYDLCAHNISVYSRHYQT
jgi:hypothetical protein